MKKNLGVFFGGRTCEHDVSIITGHQVVENANKEKYNVIPVYIARDGQWYMGEKLLDIGFYKTFNKDLVTPVYIEPNPGNVQIYSCKPAGGLLGSKRKPLATLDVVLPAMHGMNGEDGTLQGLFELCNLPHTSPAPLGSAVGMDKIAMRLLFQGAGFPVLPCRWFERGSWKNQREAALADVESSLGYPVIVKPANLGSSIGIGRADDREALGRAMEVAFCYDRRVIVEKAIDCSEINCSALGFAENVEASLCEQPVTWEQFLTFEEKYLRGGGKSAGMKSMGRIIPAPIDEGQTQRIRGLTVDIFRALDCKGVVRVDFMIDKADNTLYVNEINTIPGSLAFYLWEPLGVPFSALIDRMVEVAEAAHREKNQNDYAFDSKILEKNSAGVKSGAKVRGAKG